MDNKLNYCLGKMHVTIYKKKMYNKLNKNVTLLNVSEH